MKIKIKYFNIIREAVGIKEEIYSYSSNVTIQQLLEEACSRHKKVLSEKLFDNSGAVKIGILILLNSKLIQRDQLDQTLSDNDEIFLFHVIGGG